MPHISKKKLDKELAEKIFNQLIGVFKVAGRKNAIDYFTEELFTPTEKIMFAKRLAAVLLLDRGMPQHVISDKLNMSPSTIARLSLHIEVGKYKGILRIAGRNKVDVLEIILKVILKGMPPRVGRGRWKNF